MKKTVEYEVKNGSIMGNIETLNKISNIISSYKTDGYEHRLSIEEYEKLHEEFYNLDASNYYMADGRKITKPLKWIAEKMIGKDTVKAKWADIVNQISALYSSKFKCRAFWGKKDLLGQGVYESGSTCFGDGGINVASRLFIEKYDRAQVVVLENMDNEDAKARCIAYFAGGRHIHLTNFYFRSGFPQNPLMFVEAIRRLIGIEHVIFKDHADNPDLPIYLNGRTIHVYTKRSFEYTRERKLPCSECDEMTPEREMYHRIDSNTHYIGCSEECANQNKPYSCDSCGCGLDEDDACYANDYTYCNDCFNDNYFHCYNCNNVTHYDDGREAECYYYCRRCYDEFYITCECCDAATSRDESYYSEYLHEDRCYDCYHDKHDTCFVCSEYFHNQELTEHDNDKYCEACYEENIVACTECKNDVRAEDATEVSGYNWQCNDCYTTEEVAA